MLAGLLQIEDRPIRAGILIGLLTIKPQLGLLIPVILIAERSYATFAAAAVTDWPQAGYPRS